MGWRGLALLERLGSKLWRHVQPLGQRLFPIKSPLQAFLLGALWGWLPCGLVYATVAWALSTANAFDAALLMLGFGIGTLPAMLLVGSAFNFFKGWVKSPLVRTSAGVLLIAFGAYSVYTGLGHSHHHHANLSSTDLQHSGDCSEMRVPAILRKVS